MELFKLFTSYKLKIFLFPPLFLFFASSVSAQEIFINLKAESFHYEEVKGKVVAEGSVEVNIEDFLIKADRMEVDVASSVATAEGNVFIEREDYVAQGKSLTYSTSEEAILLKDFYTIYSPEKIKGKLFVRISEFIDSKKDKYGLDASATTCDYEEPHYHVRARRFEYYPEDKIVCFSVTLYVGSIPVFWLPYLIYDLRERRSSLSISFGHNAVEGDFVKTAFDYFFNNNHYGLIYLDLMSKKGLGKGFRHKYKLDERNTGSFLLYHLEERDTGLTDWAMIINHGLRLSDETKLSFKHDYKNIYKIAPRGRYDQNVTNITFDYNSDRKIYSSLDIDDNRQSNREKYQFKLDHGIGDYDSSFFLKLDKSKVKPLWSNLSTNLAHKQPLFVEDQTLTTKVNFVKYTTDEGYPGDERMDPEVVFTKKTEAYTLKGTYNFYVDTDGSSYLADKNVEFVKKKPEVWIGFSPINLNFFSLSTNLEYGKYRERKYISSKDYLRDYTTGRYKVGLDASKTYSLGFGTSLNLFASMDQYVYDPGDARFVYEDRVGLNTGLWGFFKNNLNYESGYSNGGTPFYFDTIGVNKNLINDTVTLYYLSIISWSTSSGYNFLTKKYQDISSALYFTPDERLGVTLRGGYSIENQRYTDFSTKTILRPFPKIYAEISSTHDLNYSMLKSASSLFDVEVGETWQQRVHVRAYSKYDYFTGRYELKDLSIVKDLHCWEAKFTYSAWREEYVFTLMLKAFPSMPVGWASGERGFFLEGFDREMIYQPSPRRY